MKSLTVAIALALLVGCSVEDTRRAEREAAAQLKQAKEAAATQAEKALDASKTTLDGIRASLDEIDHEAADAYHKALDEADTAIAEARAEWNGAAEASEDEWSKLEKKTEQANQKIMRAAARIKALTGDVKNDFVLAADAVLTDIRRDVDAIQADAAKLDDESREAYEKLAAGFKKDWDATTEALQDAKDAADDSWQETRHDINHGLLKLKSEVREAREKIKNG